MNACLFSLLKKFFKKIKETDKRTMKKIFIFSFKLFFQNEQFERKFSLSFLKEKTPDH
jgi:hypothetical protein